MHAKIDRSENEMFLQQRNLSSPILEQVDFHLFVNNLLKARVL